MAETFDWLKPSLLWESNGADMRRQDFFRPALLEYGTDKFMEEFFDAVAAPRTARFRSTLARPARQGASLKLFQPAHGRFYLTSASLCCRIPGFPDREVQSGEGESVFFVLRKKVGNVEYAWSGDETQKGWQAVVAAGASVPAKEERFPLFQTTTAKSRAVFFGYVPVASQDTFAAAPTESLVDYSVDPRLEELSARFIEPLTDDEVLFGVGVAPADATRELRTSVYLLLDLWEYFDAYLPDVATTLRAATTATLQGKQRDLALYLQAQALGGTLKLDAALRQVALKQAQLNGPGDIAAAQLATLGFTSDYNLKTHSLSAAFLDDKGLKARVDAALDSQPALAPPAVEVPKLSPAAGDFYVLRYVYERAQCDPPHRYVSRPSEPFQLAPFFDPDAPARDIRVGLPVDVSVAGLRKFKKNVAFMMSKELRNKLQSISGKEKDILDGKSPGPEGTFDIGHICSFSLPIITLCAFILLMIIVILLNIVFWWLPLLKICFPLKLKAK